jgi:hypothetical protein
MKFLSILLFGLNLFAQSKVALLIGNSEYEKPLKNPINDVSAIKKTLLSIGFQRKNIYMLTNASKEKIEKELFKFNKIASENEISLIYFSGHGMQYNNRNYLFPANTKVTKELDLKGLVELDFFIQSASSAKYGIILIDACRNNPLINSFQKSIYRGISFKKGLGQVKVPKRAEVVIGFATEADSLANDGKGNNSPYVKALVKNLKLNSDIRNVLGQVGLDVSMATNGQQNPILKSTLGINSVCLTGNCNNRLNANNEAEIEYDNSHHEYKFDVSVENSTISSQSYISKKRYSWKEAMEYCKNLNQQWRLPTRDELKKLSKGSIYTFDTKKNWEKWFNKNYGKKSFSNSDNSIFWSSSSYNYNDDGAWFVDFSKKYEDWRSKDSKFFAMCVSK